MKKLLTDDEWEYLKTAVDDLVSELPARQARVIVTRFGLEDGRPRSLEDIGREEGLSRERIRQMEAVALRKLRHPDRMERLEEYNLLPESPLLYGYLSFVRALLWKPERKDT